MCDKSNQKRSRQECFFAAQAFARQIRQNLGCNLFALLRLHLACASAKSCYALPPHLATIVLPDFTRSFPVGKKQKKPHLILSKGEDLKKIRFQKRVKACQKSGPGVWPAAWKLFSGLIYSHVVCFFWGAHELALLRFFWYFFVSRQKRTSLRGN